MTQQAKRKPKQVGYARVSTTDQDPELQLDALKAAGCDEVVEERASGGTRIRPVLEGVLDRLEPGDTLVVWKLDRLGRSVADLDNIIASELVANKIGFKSLTDGIELPPNGDEIPPTTEAFIGMLAVFARFERSLIRERVKAGKVNAKRKGRKQGRKFTLTDEDADLALELYENGASVPSLCAKWNVSKWTIYRALERAKDRRQEVNGGER
jgi:DNA invertase Pin-like site-specific DNA recombinase